MKKMIVGIMLFIAGLAFSLFFVIHAALNPCIYNGTGGLLGAFLHTDTLGPVIISLIVMVCGIAVCAAEAWRSELSAFIHRHNSK